MFVYLKIFMFFKDFIIWEFMKIYYTIYALKM